MENAHEFNIKIKDLSWSYGDREVLKDINFNFESNKFYTIMGPNGSGKTTFLKNILGIFKTKKDCVLIDGIDIMKLKNRKIAAKLSYVPQSENIDFDFSVYDIVLMGRAPYKNNFSGVSIEDKKIVKDAMDKTNTWELKDKNINSLSGGERQRVIIARAIAQDTNAILLDEPISHLDLFYQIELMNIITSLKKTKTIIAVLHDLNLASQYSDCILLLNRGEIVSCGDAKKVITKENIKRVYNLDVNIFENPVSGMPYIIPS